MWPATWTTRTPAARHLTRFINYNRADAGNPFGPQLDETMVTTSLGKSDYHGLTLGVRKRFSQRLPARGELRAVARQGRRLERARSVHRPQPSTSTICRSTTATRIATSGTSSTSSPTSSCRTASRRTRACRPAGRSRSPPNPRVQNGVDLGRNTERKDNEYFSFDWRVSRPFQLGRRYELIPTIEMFNTFNNANNINPLSTPALFNFDGFLRTGVGDPRQVQLAVKLTF